MSSECLYIEFGKVCGHSVDVVRCLYVCMF